MKFTRLNARGFSHEIVVVFFILVFAVAGVGYMVASRAAASMSGMNMKSKSSSSKSATPNPSNCKIELSSNTVNQGLFRIKEYDMSSMDGQPLQDHILTMFRNDAAQAKNGYCFDRYLGWAYKTQQAGTVPLYQYYNSTSHLHYYSTAASAPAGFTGQVAVAWVSAQPISGKTQPVYALQNPQTQSYYYAGDQTNIASGEQYGFKLIN